MAGLIAFFVAALFVTQQTPRPQSLQGSTPSASSPDDEVEYVCPMDKDVRSKTPGKCSRCGMTLVLGIPDPHEYPVHITPKPKVLKPGQDIQLTMSVEDPDTQKQVSEFTEVHEKLYHFFLVSQDLTYFRHVHPEIQPDATFSSSV